MAWRTVTLNDNGGSGSSPSTLYYATDGKYWATAKNTGASYRTWSLTSCPTRAGYVFAGFYTSKTGGSLAIRPTGGILGLYTPASDEMIYARWHDYATITFSKGSGSGGTDAIYYRVNGGGFYSDTALTAEISSITPPTGGGVFRGYELNGERVIDERGNITGLHSQVINTDITLTARWLGECTDYFNLASATLVPFESDEGTNRVHLVTRHYGSFKKTGSGAYEGASATSEVWRNPTVKYMVVGDMTLAVTLGRAFAAEKRGSTVTKTGYMIVSATVETRLRRFPVVTIQGTANEGANAINSFAVSVPILARARPQNLLGAVSGGGELQTSSLAATCDPVVLAENMIPCASDVVGGRYELHAETLAADGESAPTATASGGFTMVADPPVGAGADYIRYRVTARKEIY